LHPISHKLLCPGGVLRVQLDLFILGADITDARFRKLHHLLGRTMWDRRGSVHFCSDLLQALKQSFSGILQKRNINPWVFEFEAPVS
jgi:hypothetical protein